ELPGGRFAHELTGRKENNYEIVGVTVPSRFRAWRKPPLGDDHALIFLQQLACCFRSLNRHCAFCVAFSNCGGDSSPSPGPFSPYQTAASSNSIFAARRKTTRRV